MEKGGVERSREKWRGVGWSGDSSSNLEEAGDSASRPATSTGKGRQGNLVFSGRGAVSWLRDISSWEGRGIPESPQQARMGGRAVAGLLLLGHISLGNLNLTQYTI